ncbi:MAG: DUF559 domain-containing protein [Solirubrobacteraceae bacterium]
MIAVMQAGRVSRAQLLAAGITDSAIRTRVRRCHLIPEHPGVYAVGHQSPLPYARETAALLSLPEGAVLSHHTAASMWHVRTGDVSVADPAEVSVADPVDVTVGPNWTGRRDGVRIHRTRTLSAQDISWRYGLPVTAPARTLLDQAAQIEDRRLELALDELLLAKRIRLADVADLLRRVKRHPGRRKLAALLGHHRGPMLTRSEAEERMLVLITAAGLARPRVNARLGGYEVDFLWPDHHFAVEVGGFRFHSGRSTFERDRRKDQALRQLGVDVMRVTWRQLEEEPYALVARIAEALALAGRSAAA